MFLKCLINVLKINLKWIKIGREEWLGFCVNTEPKESQGHWGTVVKMNIFQHIWEDISITGIKRTMQ